MECNKKEKSLQKNCVFFKIVSLISKPIFVGFFVKAEAGFFFLNLPLILLCDSHSEIDWYVACYNKVKNIYAVARWRSG